MGFLGLFKDKKTGRRKTKSYHHLFWVDHAAEKGLRVTW